MITCHQSYTPYNKINKRCVSKGGGGGGKGGGGSTKSGGGGSGESGGGPSSMKTSGGDGYSRKYYRYIGSLTTPLYTKNVAWTIVNKVRTVSRAQLYEIRDVVHNEAKANARSVQALNNRWLKL
ncbi:alpha carbonic anhydrase 7-like protein [Tanacetum coccineum]